MSEDLATRIAGLFRGSFAYDDEYGGGLTNHEPMVLGALAFLVPRLGLPADRPEAFSAAYRRKLDPRGATGTAAPALGDYATRGGFEARFAAAFAARDPIDVAREAIAELGEGLPAAAGHGLLRVGFAIAGRGALPGEVWRAELARALAYWSASHVRLYAGPRGRLPLGEVLAALPELSPDERARIKAHGQITERQALVAAWPAYLAAVSSADPSPEPAASLPLLSRIAARVPDFTLLHALTTGEILLSLARELPGLDLAPLQRGWVDFVVAACLTEGLSPSLAAPLEPAPGPAADDPALTGPLAATVDDHAIKSAYALVRLEDATGDASFRAAARSLVARWG
jgi:hypothetical protein